MNVYKKRPSEQELGQPRAIAECVVRHSEALPAVLVSGTCELLRVAPSKGPRWPAGSTHVPLCDVEEGRSWPTFGQANFG